jgi:hypothetical protein
MQVAAAADIDDQQRKAEKHGHGNERQGDNIATMIVPEPSDNPAQHWPTPITAFVVTTLFRAFPFRRATAVHAFRTATG